MDDIIRNIQIDLIMDNPNPIIKTFNNIWNELSICETNVYTNIGGEFIYYNKNNKWVFFFREDKYGEFLCNYYRYWSIFKYEHGLSYDILKDITKLLVENKLNNSLQSINIISSESNRMVEETLIRKLNKYG